MPPDKQKEGDTKTREAIRASAPVSLEKWAELVESWEKPVFSLILRQVRNGELARDLTQEVFLKACKNRLNFDPAVSKFKWIFSVVDSVIKDHRRKWNSVKRREPPVPAQKIDGQTVACTSEREDPGPTAVENLLENERSIELHTAINSLSDREQLIVKLYYFSGLSINEVAIDLNKTQDGVKSALQRVRKKLGILIAHPDEEFFPEKKTLKERNHDYIR